MPKSSEYLEYVLEQLSGLPNVTSRRMFSGAGFYQDDVFFGLLFSDTLYLKVNDGNRADYESRGMQRFKPYKDKPHLSFTYYEVPAEVLEDRDELLAWAQKSVRAAVEIALEKQAKKPRRRKAKRGKVKRARAKQLKTKRPPPRH
jgi:DNA transformation protein and related proteins